MRRPKDSNTPSRSGFSKSWPGRKNRRLILAMASTFRENLQQARTEYASDGRISDASLAVMKRLLPLLPGTTPEDVDALTPDHPGMDSMIDDLLYRVDVIPAGLALWQAAYESGYGTSRFALEGNSLFGQ